VRLVSGAGICGLADDVVVRTLRLVLSPVRRQDAAVVHALLADWEVVRWLSAPPWPLRLEDTCDYLERASRRGGSTERYLVIGYQGHIAGAVSVRDRSAGHLQRDAGPNIGYWLGRAFWNKGLMTEAVAGLVGQIFAGCAAPAIYSGAYVGNAASLRVQEKLGFRRDGETLLHSNPCQTDLPHINTVLTRSAFESVACDRLSE
jgi:RimJ/RimL family protein N-acetyltransferase